MEITITKKHISQGEPKSKKTCPIALAIKEQTGYKTVFVRNYGIIIGSKRFWMPDIAAKFVNYFDLNKEVKPFKFSLFIEPKKQKSK